METYLVNVGQPAADQRDGLTQLVTRGYRHATTLSKVCCSTYGLLGIKVID